MIIQAVVRRGKGRFSTTNESKLVEERFICLREKKCLYNMLIYSVLWINLIVAFFFLVLRITFRFLSLFAVS